MSKKKTKQIKDMEMDEINQVSTDIDEEVTEDTNEIVEDVKIEKQPVPVVKREEKEIVVPKIESPVQLSTGVTKLLNTLVDEGNEVSINTIKNLLTYLKQMAPSQMVEPVVGNKIQLDLYRVITYTINNESVSNFPLVYGLILKIVDEFSVKGAFAPTHVFRFVNETHTNKDEIKGFNALMNLLTTTASNVSRANSVKMIDFNRTLAIGFSEIGKSRILSFYGK